MDRSILTEVLIWSANFNRELKDGPKELWDPSLVGDQMNLFAKKHNIETVRKMTSTLHQKIQIWDRYTTRTFTKKKKNLLLNS